MSDWIQAGLRLRIKELESLVADLAAELESEVNARYAGTQNHPALKHKFEDDMSIVLIARATLKGAAQ